MRVPFQRFGQDRDKFGRWLLDFGDQVARTQQHAHPAGPTTIELLSVVADDLTPHPGGTAGRNGNGSPASPCPT
ncbi:hypothetical protein AB0L10_43865 [Streptomyces flaveolus]|uniref:hypothetical protein n=1 Tax=Streptomyces flaveolus TaxID=67297 RepID=UPI0034407EF2